MLRTLLLRTLVAGLCACGASEYAEVEIVVDTDLPVPSYVDRLRVDLYSPEGTWYASEDFFLGNRQDWPASFSVFESTLGGGGQTLVRLRAYPTGATRAYRGERAPPEAEWIPPSYATSVEELCASPPLLELGGIVTQRQGRFAILPNFGGSQECLMFNNIHGSTAARVEITEAGTYHFAVVNASPTNSGGDSADTRHQVTLQLRRDCEDGASALACFVGVDLATFNVEWPELQLDLEPGTYHLVTGGSSNFDGGADITLAAWSEEIALYSKVTPAEVPDLAVSPLLNGKLEGTPEVEPDPQRSVERLLWVELTPDTKTAVSVLLSGECLGTEANLGPDSTVDPERATTCVGRSGVREAATGPTAELGAVTPGPSLAGSFARGEACKDQDSSDDVVCIPSGLVLIGDATNVSTGNIGGSPRPAALSRFWLDRYEVTVAEFRQALSNGLTIPEWDFPLSNDGKLPVKQAQVDDVFELCTWSDAPASDAETREALPMTCANWHAARAYCQFLGGDLPSDAQFEYAALSAGHDREVPFPWGTQEPSCYCDGEVDGCRAEVASRAAQGMDFHQECIALGVLPLAARSVGGPFGDESPLGLVGMSANVAEWTLDAPYPLDHSCWRSEPIHDPICWEDEPIGRTLRGTGFYSGLGIPLDNRVYWDSDWPLPSTGFRCAYSARQE